MAKMNTYGNAVGADNSFSCNTGVNWGQPNNTGTVDLNGGWGNTVSPSGTVTVETTNWSKGDVNTSLFGENYYNNDVDPIPTSSVVDIIKEALKLYNNGERSIKEVAREVDVLRSKVKSNTFDSDVYSEELKNIFGYILSDVVSTFAKSNPRDYDSIIDFLLKSFPEGAGGPIASKYSKSNSIPSVAKQIREYQVKNGFSFANTKIKFQKLINDLKLLKPALDTSNFDELYQAYLNLK